MVLVSIPEQTMHVYRNGILIGRSTVSTGSQGHSTPGGVFSILGKNREYYSKKYDNAPMPNMQRLTDTGICMHSGNLPGYPASHGCIRMPYDFSQLLFSATAQGGHRRGGRWQGPGAAPRVESRPVACAEGSHIRDGASARENEYDWKPERSASGPVTMVVSAADKAIYVYRNGKPIGRAPVEISGRGSLGNHVYSLLEGTTGQQSSLAPGREARRWMTVTSSGRSVDAEKIASRLRVNPEFAAKVYDTLTPGTTVVITDQPVVRSRGKAAVLEGLRPRGPESAQNPPPQRILPRDTEGLEVVLATRVVAADAVELHGLITVHRQHERRAEANALLFNVAFDLIDRRASAFEITSVERYPAAGRESIAEA